MKRKYRESAIVTEQAKHTSKNLIELFKRIEKQLFSLRSYYSPQKRMRGGEKRAIITEFNQISNS